MVSKVLGSLVLVFCLIVAVLRGIGIMQGDFILPLILLSQLLILGYIVNILQLISKDIFLRYTRNNRDNPTPPMHTWN